MANGVCEELLARVKAHGRHMFYHPLLRCLLIELQTDVHPSAKDHLKEACPDTELGGCLANVRALPMMFCKCRDIGRRRQGGVTEDLVGLRR